jgi:hypothetical protein
MPKNAQVTTPSDQTNAHPSNGDASMILSNQKSILTNSRDNNTIESNTKATADSKKSKKQATTGTMNLTARS